MSVAGPSRAARAAAAERLASVAVDLLAPKTPGRAVLVADLREFLESPDRLALDLKPREPLKLSFLARDDTDWRRILDSLDVTLTVNRRAPFLLKTRPTPD
jgi:hypothetical protein